MLEPAHINVITRYFTVEAESSHELDKRVNELLLQGWQLYGNPYRESLGEFFWFYQSMIKDTT